MAEALLRQLGGAAFQGESAGFEPRPVLPPAVAAMDAIGIDISGAQSKAVFDLYRAGRIFDYVVTVCDEATAEQCPIFPGVCQRLHWTFPDPSVATGTSDERTGIAADVRDLIKAKIEAWLKELEHQGTIPSRPTSRGESNMSTANVLFACIHNAGRSQMAAAWFKHLADPAKAKAISAGTEPGTRVHPEVVEAMKEVGIDLSNGKPQFLSDELAASSSLLVTMGCGEACPHVPGSGAWIGPSKTRRESPSSGSARSGAT
jgi:arsenate reductase